MHCDNHCHNVYSKYHKYILICHVTVLRKVGTNPLVPLFPIFEGGGGAHVGPRPCHHPFFYASAILVILVCFFNWHVFPEFISFEVNDRLFILSIFNKFVIFESNFCQTCKFLVQVHFWLNDVTINDISVIHVTSH